MKKLISLGCAAVCASVLSSACALAHPFLPDAPSPFAPLKIELIQPVTPALQLLKTGSTITGSVAYLQNGSPVSVPAQAVITEEGSSSKICLGLTIAADRIPASPVLFYPSPDPLRTCEIPPAGGVYPADLNRGVLRLSWRRGAPAHALLKLAEAGFTIEYLNYQRLYLELDIRTPENPWAADWEAFSAGIVYSSGSAAALNPGKTAAVEIILNPGLEGREWYMVNPFLPDPVVVGESLLLPYTEGDSRFCAVSHKGDILTLWQDGHMWQWVCRNALGGGKAEPAGWNPAAANTTIDY